MISTQLENNQPPLALQPQHPGSIPLSVLIDFLLQKTYNELTVMSELLQQKSDFERKIDIVNFASRTRQSFVRILALSKWAQKNASKIVNCNVMSQFLDRQSALFEHTADSLHRMAKETIPRMALPCLQVPIAAEILKTGKYLRIPNCIKDRIVTPDPITSEEKRWTLSRLEQTILFRLSTSSDIPRRMRNNLEVENGRVTFNVDHEFRVSLTVTSDTLTDPWRLVDLKILVEDDGKSLVHQQQIQYLHQLIQSRLSDWANTEKPLHDLYCVLHTFCSSLQLEACHSQVLRLQTERLNNYVLVKYSPGASLILNYWKDFKLILRVDSKEPLQILHDPQLDGEECRYVDDLFESDRLSLEKLFVRTIYVRAKQRLRKLKEEIREKLGNVECEVVVGFPTVLLRIPLLQPSMPSEMLTVSVDTLRGTFRTHVPLYEPPMIGEIERALNCIGDKTEFESLVEELRFWMVLRRCERNLQHLPVVPTEFLPLDDVKGKLSHLSRHKLFVKLLRQSGCYVIIELKGNKENPGDVYLDYHLLVTNIRDCFLGVSSLVRLDSIVVTHDRSKESDLAHVVAMCDERIPFTTFVDELNRRKICNQGIQVENDGPCFCIKLVEMPECDDVDKDVLDDLRRSILSCSIRIHQSKHSRTWIVEYVLCHCPLVSLDPREREERRSVCFSYVLLPAEQIGYTVDCFLSDWNSIVHMHQAALSYFDASSHDYSLLAGVKSFSYERLVISYGPNRANTVTVEWRNAERKFHLVFGVVENAQSATNPHSIVAFQLNRLFNEEKSLRNLVKLLSETYFPFLSISKVRTTPISAGLLEFIVIPHSPTRIQISFRNVYCLDVRLHTDGLVAISDSTDGRFTPIPSLRVFLDKFIVNSTSSFMTHDAFDSLCTPLSEFGHRSPLERFFGCVYLRSCLQRVIHSETDVRFLPCSEEPGVVIFQVGNFLCCVSQDLDHLQTLRLEVKSIVGHEDEWSVDEFRVLERFFDTRVASHPYKPSGLIAFVRLLKSPRRILKDFVKIMSLELFTEPDHEWRVNWCLTIPPAASAIGPVGSVGFIVANTKYLFFLKLTRQMSVGAVYSTLVLPLVHDVVNNTTMLVERPGVTALPNSSITAILNQYSACNPNPNLSECTLATCVRHLLTNLVLLQ